MREEESSKVQHFFYASLNLEFFVYSLGHMVFCIARWCNELSTLCNFDVNIF